MLFGVMEISSDGEIRGLVAAAETEELSLEIAKFLNERADSVGDTSTYASFMDLFLIAAERFDD